ncbi:hypothetical protein VNI00_015894 [Paramarasmius palmivorus]|uniref:Peptidase S53 domain-containing protein n=1 Tax=Paramarasmius palmivorus TaxID=297713 RepID=A0AAW0BJJ4_9AGAR
MLPFLLVAVSIVSSYAAPSFSDTHLVHERRTISPSGWIPSRRADPMRVHPLRVGLAQQNLDRLEELLLSVSDPTSQSFGQHWSPQELVDAFSPSRDSISAVLRWLSDSGISPERAKLSANKGWIQVNTTIAETEQLLRTEFHSYVHSETGIEHIGCKEYSIPVNLTPHIDLIRPTVDFTRAPRKHLPKQGAAVNIDTPTLSTCDQFITPDCIRALYNFDYTPKAESGQNTYGIVEFTPQAFLSNDLDLFFANFSPSLVGTRPTFVSIDGGVAQTQNQSFDFNGESDLDLEYAMALTNPQPVVLLQTGDLVEGLASVHSHLIVKLRELYECFGHAFRAVVAEILSGGDDPEQDGIYPDPLPGGFKGPESCGILAPPHVVSISYGQDESTISAKSATRQCNEYAKLGLMGSTILYSSGDNGVAGNGGVCLDTNGEDLPIWHV